MTSYPLRSARIGTRLAACFVMIVVAMLVADVVAVWLFRMTAAPAEQLAKADRISLAVIRVHFDIDMFKDNLAALASTRDIRRFKTEGALLREKFLENVAQCSQLIELSAEAQQDPVIRSALETVRVTLPSQLDTTLDLASAGDWVAVDLRMRNQVQALVQLSSLLVQKVEAGLAQERAEAIESGYQARRQLVLILPAAALLTLLVAVVLGWNVTRSIIDPLSQLEAGARALAKGDFGHRVAIRGEDELAELGRVLNDSAQQLAVLYETLRSNEARFRLTIDTIPAFVWSALPDGSVDFINRRWLEFSGLSLEQGLGFGWEIAVHPEDRTHFLEAWAAAVASGKAMEFEARVRRADGQYRWLLIRNVPLHDETANIVKWYGTSTDIEDHKRAEETLRKQANLLDLTHDTIFVMDMEGLIKYWNRGAEEQYGWSGEQVVGTVVHDLLKTVFPVPLEQIKAEVTGTGRWEGELVHTKKDGTQVMVESRWSLQRDEQGAPVAILETNSDITERKRAEEALRRSEAYLAEGQRLSRTGSWAWSPATGRSTYWSDEMFRIFGLDPEQGVPTAETFWQRVHPEDYDRTYELLQKARLGKMEYAHEHRIVLFDGTVKHIHAVGHPVPGENGEVAEYVGTVIDITDRKRAEEEIERLRQLEADLAHINRVSMLGELAASIAHEINQPLSGVVSNASAGLRWLAGDVPNLEEAREGLRRIVRDGKRAGAVIARIRALTRKDTTPRRKLELNETIREVLALVGDEAKKENVTIRTAFADDLSSVSGDRVQLQQVALNLVMNAIEAMSSVGDRARELKVTTRNLDADQVQVTVEDSGIGIAPETLDKIFESFYTTKPSGMGMGLSICRSVLQAHGGRLWATAKDGPGTLFHFTLPKYHEAGSHAGV